MAPPLTTTQDGQTPYCPWKFVLEPDGKVTINQGDRPGKNPLAMELGFKKFYFRRNNLDIFNGNYLSSGWIAGRPMKGM